MGTPVRARACTLDRARSVDAVSLETHRHAECILQTVQVSGSRGGAVWRPGG